MAEFVASKIYKHLMTIRVEAAAIQRLVMETEEEDGSLLRLTKL